MLTLLTSAANGLRFRCGIQDAKLEDLPDDLLVRTSILERAESLHSQMMIFNRLPVRSRISVERVSKRWKRLSLRSWAGVQLFHMVERPPYPLGPAEVRNYKVSPEYFRV